MKNKSLLIAFSIAMIISGLGLVGTENLSTVRASTEVTGIISSDTTWTQANSPYSLTGPVKVNNGVTLMIEAGVTVNLNNYYIQVEGTLQARGNGAEKINFNSGSIKFTDESNDWDEQTGTGCIVENAIISSTISLASFHVEDASPKINNNTIGSNEGSYYSIEVWGGSPTICNNTINGPIGLLYAGSARSNSVISGNVISGGGEGIEISCMGTPTIERNVIMSNNGMGIYFIASYGERTPIIRNNTIAHNSVGLRVLYRASPSLFAPIIKLNNFQDNAEYNVYFDPDSDSGFDAYNLNAAYNWWGTTDTDSISQSIYDFEDNFNLGSVTFIPFLNEPNPEAPAISTSPTPTPTPTPSPTASPEPSPTPEPTPTPTATPFPTPIPVPGQSFFFVESNSTVKDLFFNSTSAELSFTVTGETGTAGYVKVTTAKSLVSSVQSVKVCLDGTELSVAITEDGDLWLLRFTYMHSTHQVMVSLTADSGTTTVGVESWVWIASTVVVGMLLAVAVSLICRRRGFQSTSLATQAKGDNQDLSN